MEVLPTPPLPPTNTNCGLRTPAANSSPYLRGARVREKERERRAIEKERAREEVLAAAVVQVKS